MNKQTTHMAFKCLIRNVLVYVFYDIMTLFTNILCLRYHSFNGAFKPDEPLEIHYVQTLCTNVLLHVLVYILKRSF